MMKPLTFAFSFTDSYSNLTLTVILKIQDSNLNFCDFNQSVKQLFFKKKVSRKLITECGGRSLPLGC